MDEDACKSASDWSGSLIAAVDADNEFPPDSCDQLRTLRVLEDAPDWAREHASLALADLAAVGSGPMADLRADTVARDFTVLSGVGQLNVLVARMLVPGSPWPGHRGMEAVVFRSRSSRTPNWFPEHETSHDVVTFADTVASSAALRNGHGHVIFPELLAVSEPLETQRFGIVLADHLAYLYRTHTLPVAAALGWLNPSDARDPGELRTIAFHAHEWGHRATDEGYAENVSRHRRRLLAVVSEVTADVAALQMLAASSHPLAPRVARALVFDRILRDAWLARWEAHVASIVGRVLLQFLIRSGALTELPEGLTLELAAAHGSLEPELAALHRTYRASNRGDDTAAIRYFAENGWTLDRSGISLSSAEPVLEQLQHRAREAQSA
ncbi:MAG TPA: hypothetical protein VMT37_03035 [Solirubrobacterales bacterium]|nr:hypothetical protein [Solirubrobacterales bacterium]